MSANPIEGNPTPKPTGSLEELFRHHLGEEAAVPPRPMLWDQIDNSLLIRQNETYRRRLAATRWVAAASLLLATLAGTGWWSLRDAHLDESAVVISRGPANVGALPVAGSDATAGKPPYANGQGGSAAQLAASTATGAAAPTLATRGANGAVDPSRSASRASEAAAHTALAARAATNSTRLSTASEHNNLAVNSPRPSAAVAPFGGTNAADAPIGSETMPANGPGLAVNAAPTATASPQGAAAGARTEALARTTSAAAAATAGASTGAATTALASATAAAGATAGAFGSAAAVALPEQVSLLTARPAVLSIANAAALPNGLAAVAVPADASGVAPGGHRWHYGASYTAGLFNPNVDFSRAGIAPDYDYNPALGAGSPALTETAAAEYRANLRPGLSQRLALLATRHLGGHWSLGTGAELSQATARSASATAFVGEQLLDLGQPGTGPLRTTNFRYRLASIPIELRYANSAKRGWSLYGRLGGVVSALLGARSEVEGSPEATRTYSLLSAGTPYRRVLGSLRGGAGVQFRPASSHWGLTVGPVAEIGLLSLNAHPTQGFLAQRRPYGFGVEASVVFGR